MFTDAIAHLRTGDPVLRKIITGSPTFSPHKNYYHSLISSILSQQLSVKASNTIEQRFKNLFNGQYPSPEELLEKDLDTLRGVGVSRQKASYIQDLARHILDGRVNFAHINNLSNDEIIRELTQVKGIGVWTVHMFLIFCMGRLDVLPVGDLGIRAGIQKLYELDHLPAASEIEHIAQKNNWHPYESVASWYIWAALDNAPTIQEEKITPQ